MPTNEQIYIELIEIKSLLLQLLSALSDDNDPPQYDFEGLPIPNQRPENQEL